MDRSQLVTLMGDARNGWMSGCAITSHHLAAAVVSGKITEGDILDYPPYEEAGYPEDMSRRLASNAGLGWHEHELPLPGGVLFGSDSEDIGIAVACLRDVLTGTVSIEGEGWSFYEEALAENSLGEVSAALQAHTTITQAAQLVLDADEDWRQRNS